MAAGRANRQHYWMTAFRRSQVGRAIIRRLPGRVKRALRAGRRWQRQTTTQLRSRWHRSLQLRVVATTLVMSVLVIAILGFFLVHSIANGLLVSAENAGAAQVKQGVQSAESGDGPATS